MRRAVLTTALVLPLAGPAAAQEPGNVLYRSDAKLGRIEPIGYIENIISDMERIVPGDVLRCTVPLRAAAPKLLPQFCHNVSWPSFNLDDNPRQFVRP